MMIEENRTAILHSDQAFCRARCMEPQHFGVVAIILEIFSLICELTGRTHFCHAHNSLILMMGYTHASRLDNANGRLIYCHFRCIQPVTCIFSSLK
jgi:hypothetical protein